MEPGRITITCDYHYISINNKAISNLYKFHRYMPVYYINNLIIVNQNKYFSYKHLFEYYNDVIVDKLEISDYNNVLEIISYFKKVNIIKCSNKERLPELPYLIKTYSYYQSGPNKLCINELKPQPGRLSGNYIEQFYVIPDSDITHICIFITKKCTNDALSTILSHPFERINLIFSNYYKKHDMLTHIDIKKLVDILIENPAKHIFICNVKLDYEDLTRLINKPDIISLRFKRSKNYLRDSLVFNDNYTILRFYCRGEEWFNHLPQEIYDRNIKILEDQRFRKTKALI